MDYEKKYKEALARARQFSEHPLQEDSDSIVEYIFPELKESEDGDNKRISKEITQFLKQNNGWNREWLVWLEKQGEQKPVVIFPKFKIGDNIKTTNEEPLTITKIDGKGYWSEDLFVCGFDDADKWELVEQKPIYTEEDENNFYNAIYACIHIYGKDSDIVDWLKSIKQRIGG